MLNFDFDIEKINTVYKIDEFKGSSDCELYPFAIYGHDIDGFNNYEAFIVGVKDDDHNYYTYEKNYGKGIYDVNNEYSISRINPGTRLVIREFEDDFTSDYKEKIVTVKNDSTINNPGNKLIVVIGIEKYTRNNRLLNRVYESLGE